MEERNYQRITVSCSAGIATVTLNVPDRRNALGAAMINELLYAIDDASADANVRAVVLTGAGGVFSAGADLQQMSGTNEEGPALEPKGDFVDLLLRFQRLGKPAIARVQGAARGGAVGLIGSCHLAVAAESATLGTPEIRLGLWPMTITAVLQRVMARRPLMRMMLLGEKLPAPEAASAGLVTEVVPDDQLDARVDELSARLARQSPTAVRMGLEACHAHEGEDLATALPALRERLLELLGTQDAQEGLAAFGEKRDPHWTGK